MKYYLRLCFLFIAYCCSTTNSIAQKPAKAEAYYYKAIEKIRDGAMKEAIELLNKSIQADTNYLEAYLSMAGIYQEMKEYQTSLDYYNAIQQKDAAGFKPFLLNYSISLAGLGKFTEALTAINSFLLIPDLSERSIKSAAYRKRCYEFAVDYAKKHAADNYIFKPVNLGDSINGITSEYYPTLTVNDSMLVFTRRAAEGWREDFMQSYRTATGFTEAKKIKGDLNDEPLKGGVSISADGEWLVFAGNFGDKGMGDFDIYISYYTSEGWSEPENLGPNINTEYWESAPCLSPDKRTLYFSSNRPGGFGGKDLYVSTRMQNGKWERAKNMGHVINSIGDDHSPYIHADNQTLYFASDGWTGYGASDLFISRRDFTGNWATPENLGYPINTIDAEGSLAVSANGLTAYYTSDRSDSHGNLDLYQFDLRKDIRPYRTLYVKGVVTDSTTHKGIPCAVELIDNNNRSALMKIQTDETGNYFAPLPMGKDYTFTVNRKGYLFYSQQYLLNNHEPDSTYIKNIALQPVVLNATAILQNVQFETNSFVLLPVSLIELDKLLQILIENPTIKIEIAGHTDNTGVETTNQLLSTNRSKTVRDYLLLKGVDGNRINYKGYGSTKPIANNTTAEGRAKNRRTEFIVIGM